MSDRSVVVRLQPTLDAPAAARAAVRAASTQLTDPDLRAEAELLTSELVTNAVRHGEGVVTVAVECESTGIAVAVGDASPVRSAP